MELELNRAEDRQVGSVRRRARPARLLCCPVLGATTWAAWMGIAYLGSNSKVQLGVENNLQFGTA